MRPSRDEVFIEMVGVMAKRSVCKRSQVGAMIVVDGRPVSVGYNGPPSGHSHCDECNGESCDISIHAEVNAIVFAAKEGISIKGGTLYCTMSPCINCAKVIINSGIERIVYKEEYRDASGINLLRGVGLMVGTIGNMFTMRDTTYWSGLRKEWLTTKRLVNEEEKKIPYEREPHAIDCLGE